MHSTDGGNSISSGSGEYKRGVRDNFKKGSERERKKHNKKSNFIFIFPFYFA